LSALSGERGVKPDKAVDSFDETNINVAHAGIGSRSGTVKWSEQCMHYYNRQHPHHSVDGSMPTEAALN
jgi:hypothetical protein